jgi:hypothetical protein
VTVSIGYVATLSRNSASQPLSKLFVYDPHETQTYRREYNRIQKGAAMLHRLFFGWLLLLLLLAASIRVSGTASGFASPVTRREGRLNAAQH